MGPSANGLILWHLLSLDAPTVAAVWTLFIAHCAEVTLSPAIPASMFLAVWMVYAVDRLLDGRQGSAAENPEARHLFHRRHRRAFMVAIGIAACALIPLLRDTPLRAIRMDLLLGSLLGAWFFLIHALPPRAGKPPRRLPKEFAVGLFFSAAIFLPTAAETSLPTRLIAPAILFAALCSLNCLYIFAWEHTEEEMPKAHPATRRAVLHLHALSSLLIGCSLATALVEHDSLSRLALACACSTAGLLWLNLRRPQNRTTLRAAADLALLTPLLSLLTG